MAGGEDPDVFFTGVFGASNQGFSHPVAADYEEGNAAAKLAGKVGFAGAGESAEHQEEGAGVVAVAPLFPLAGDDPAQDCQVAGEGLGGLGRDFRV